MERLINALLEERGISLTELTARLGYQSKTSLVRIMKKQANQRALNTFVKRLKTHLDLTEAERARLTEAMECLRWQEDYASSKEMLRLLRGELPADREVTLEDAVGGECSSLAARYEDAQDVRITLLNCQYVPMFGLLLDMVRSKGAQIEHFLMMPEDSARVIHAISALIPLIYEKNYVGYSYRGANADVPQGMLCADVMLVSYCSPEGTQREDLIVFDRECHGFVHAQAQPGVMLRMTGIRRDDFAPLKTVYFQGEGMESYVQFCADYAKLEYNRSVYKIKPDVGMEWIPEDILIAALQEGSVDLSGLGDLVEAFREIYAERVRNVYEKRRICRMIMKRSAMLHFAHTGQLSDHFWAMRPFTPEERVRIFRLLKDQMEHNPHCELYFLKDNDFLRDAEIAYYDGAGILVTDSNTSYAPEGNHAEVMLVHEGFMRMFKEYFERSLLTGYVMSHAEAVHFMGELIKVAQRER